MPRDTKPYSYFDRASVMETFNIKEAGSELETALKKELSSESIISLTIDVQIPEFLWGDKQGFYSSIIEICRCLNKYIIDLNIDIELLKVGQYVNEVKLNIDIKGYHPEKHLVMAFVSQRQDQISALVKAIPYPTKFSHGDSWLHFSFFMTFRHSGQTEAVADMFRNKKILLAEENELSALTFITFMEEWGCSVTKVSGGLRAFEEVKSEHYHLVLMNIHSAEMRCIEAIRKIRSFDQRIPIIGLTSPWTKDYTLDAYDAGVNNILSKPITSGELQKVLRRHLKPDAG